MKDHFYEVATEELPSQTTCFSSLKHPPVSVSFCNNNHSNHNNKKYRLATKHYSIEFGLPSPSSSGLFTISKRKLPDPPHSAHLETNNATRRTNPNNEENGEDSCPTGTTPTNTGSSYEYTCLAHSFLSLANQYPHQNHCGVDDITTDESSSPPNNCYLEAFAMKLETPKEADTFVEDGVEPSSFPDSSSTLGLSRSNSGNMYNILSAGGAGDATPTTSNGPDPSGGGGGGLMSDSASFATTEEPEMEESYYVALKGMWPTSSTSSTSKSSNAQSSTTTTTTTTTTKSKSKQGDPKKRGRNEYYCAFDLSLNYSPIVIELVSIPVPLDSNHTDTNHSTAESASVIGLIIGGGGRRRRDNVADDQRKHVSFLEFYLVSRLDNLYSKPKPPIDPKAADEGVTNNAIPLETLKLEQIKFSGDGSSSSLIESERNWERIQDSLFLNMMMSDEERTARQPSNPFEFDAPVTALHTLTVYDEEQEESYTDDGCHGVAVTTSKRTIPVTYIAVACQDGFIRIISFVTSFHSQINPSLGFDQRDPLSPLKMDSSFITKGRAPHFQIQNISDFSVDGSIVTVHLSSNRGSWKDSSIVTLTVGSLDGFTCMFRRVIKMVESMDPKVTEFQGPFLIHGGLRNLHTDRIDFVMAVAHISYGGVGSGRAFAVGLQSGRLLLFEEQEIKNTSSKVDLQFKCVWHHQLPYPIHGIAAVDVDADADKITPELIITTREGLHLFKGNLDNVFEAAKIRLQKIREKYIVLSDDRETDISDNNNNLFTGGKGIMEGTYG